MTPGSSGVVESPLDGAAVQPYQVPPEAGPAPQLAETEPLVAVRATALASVRDAVMVTDWDGVIVWVNDAFTQMSGYGAEEAVGATSSLMDLGAQDESYHRRLWETLQAGQRWRAEVVERHKDGSRYRVIQTITPIDDVAGSPTYLVLAHQPPTAVPESQPRLQELFDQAFDGAALTGDEDRLVDVEFQWVAHLVPGVHLAVVRDVGEQRRLQDAERFQAQLLDAVGEAVIATDLDGRVVHWNPAAERLYGWSRDEVMGRDIVELNVPEQARDQAAQITAQVLTGETWSGRLDARRADGTLVPVWVNDAPFYDTDGCLMGIIGVSTDISELEAARTGLARRVRQQAVVAELGQYALHSDDPRAVILEAERRVNDLLAPSFRVQVRWSPHRGSDAPVTDGVLLQVPIAAAGVLRVIRGAGEARLAHDDESFLRAVAHVISSTVRHQEATGQLEHLATHDPLTALPNRSLFTEQLELARAAVSRTGGGYMVLFLDLDEFKTINDSLGHDAGDEVLQTVATRLKGVLRPTDTLARFGGDEFAILCPATDTHEAGAAVARRVQQALTAPFGTSHGQLTVTASIGIVFGDDTAVPTALLRDVDAAMYAAKDRGRNRIEYFDTGLRELANRRLRTTAQLRNALAGDGVVVHYQPSIELATDRIVGVEALVRLRQDDGSLLPPDAFIGIAEDAGLIGALGQRVLEIACRDAAEWLAADPDFMLAVNLSARQFTDPQLADTIARTVDLAGIPATNLWLEITESALLTGPHVRTAIRTLGLRGVNFAIDDFGTGYSSLALLRDTSVDALKIDRGFVTGLLDNPRDRALIIATIDLARAFGLRTTAEGIETELQRSGLAQLGCTYAQGYLWSPPVPAEDLTAMLVTGISPVPDVPDVPGENHVEVIVPAGRAPADAEVIVAGVTRQLLHAESPAEVRDLLLAAVHQLGGRTVDAHQADDAVPSVDLTLGTAAPLLPTAEPSSVARMHLERYLPGLLADARQAMDVLVRSAQLSRDASTDSLTRLGNRATFTRLLSRVTPNDLVVALDLDHFKQTNDTHGHTAGDQVLREFAVCLTDHLRVNDHAVRLGGDEFALVLTGSDVAGGLTMLDRLRARWYERRSYPVDFSAGLTPGLPSPDATYQSADRALYTAKTAGRGRTVVADGRPQRAPTRHGGADGTADATADSTAGGAVTQPSGAMVDVAPEVERFLELIEQDRPDVAVELALHRSREGEPVTSLVQHLLAPAQQLVGERWHRGRYTVAHEHTVSGVVDDILGVLASRTSQPDVDHTLAMVCAEGEWHTTPARMAALCLRDAGWRVQFLGGSLPPEHLAASLRSGAPRAVAISCTLTSALVGVPSLIEVSHDHGLPVLAGGSGFGPDDLRAGHLGADGHALDITSAAALLNGWLDQPPTVSTGRSRTALDEERAVLSLERAGLVTATYHRLEQQVPVLADHDERQRRDTRQGLHEVLRSLDTALLVDDHRVFTDFTTWFGDLLDARGVDEDVLDATLQALDRTLPSELPRAHAVLDHGRSSLEVRTRATPGGSQRSSSGLRS